MVQRAQELEARLEVESFARTYNQSLNEAGAALVAEAQQHAGRLVARSPEGTQTYGYGDTYDEIYELLAQLNVQPHEAVVDRVDDPGHDEMF